MDAAALWNEYYEPVKRFVSKKTDRTDVDDIVQNVFMKIHANLDGLKEEERARPWIFQIARNAIADHYRKEKHPVELPEEIPVSGEDGEQDYSNEVIACFASVLPQVPEKYREALELSELQGLSQKEVAQRLGLSYSGAKSRVQRGREIMKELLTGCCHIESDAYGNIVDFRILQDEPPVWRRRRPGGDS